jgi:co-chaperonin GroES (HSP10)
MKSIKLIGPKILISPCTETQDTNTIILPDSAKKKEPKIGVILQKGRGDKFITMDDVVIGHKCCYKFGSGIPVTVNEAECVIIEYTDVLYFI